jgi:periplasmic mercuric ion binding protein
MKTLSLFAAILFSIFAINTSTAQTAKTETIKVWGNCGMCKTTIEKAAKKAGAKTADWNTESKELNVTYAENKTSSAKIQEAIAKSGYDTQDFTGLTSAYDNLPSCCKYDRKGANASMASYVCPMHPEVTSDVPAKCSKCGMDLTKSTNDQMKMYSCPMHPEEKSDKPGKCSKCGMDLTKSTKDQMKMYSCPMHPEEKSDRPGKCSKCGMGLKEKQ